MKRKYFIMLILFPVSIYAQQSEAVRLNREEMEAIFLKQNLALIAEKMNIGIADAEIAQAKVWENPVLTVHDANLWTSYTQFSVELSQIIHTANQRRKEVAVQKVSKEIAIQQFGETLRGLKVELRRSINEIDYFRQYEAVLVK
ncbi:MAG: TolC family protein, partial [Bacteroidales bacterium]|nr:TolC family protein [Bacteroidales bacterium]